jgi:hypothetical protein
VWGGGLDANRGRDMEQDYVWEFKEYSSRVGYNIQYQKKVRVRVRG